MGKIHTDLQQLQWINILNAATSVETLRENLKKNYTSIDFENLREMVIVGAAEEGQRLLHLCERWKIKVVALCDDNAEKQGHFLEGYKIYPSTIIESIDTNIPVIIASRRLLK